MKTLFISDVHLDVSETSSERSETLVRFLRQIDASVERLVVLGDLFDFWFEYKHVVFSGYFDVLRAFADLADRGVEVHFACGNHDFWAGKFLSEKLKFHIHRDGLEMDLGDKRVLAVHGDGLNPKDWSYRIYKKVARMPIVIWIFRLLHPDWAMALARTVSHGSRSMTAAKEKTRGCEAEALLDYAAGLLKSGKADVVMFGHAHSPQCHEVETPNGKGLYINTGDWISHMSYVEWNDGKFHMRLFRNGDAAED